MAPPSLHAWVAGTPSQLLPSWVALGPQVSTQQPMSRRTWRTRGRGPRRLRGLRKSRWLQEEVKESRQVREGRG